MKKRIANTGTHAPLISRPQSKQADSPVGRPAPPNPWISKRVTQRLEDARTLLVDLATDLPFAMVLRGRIAPPNKALIAQTEPLCQVIERFAVPLREPLDLAYLRERHALIGRLSAFEEAGENFLGLIRRTRSFISAQLEKGLRAAYAAAQESAPRSPELAAALQNLTPAFTAPKKRS